jgi:hypothetical protein
MLGVLAHFHFEPSDDQHCPLIRERRACRLLQPNQAGVAFLSNHSQPSQKYILVDSIRGRFGVSKTASCFKTGSPTTKPLVLTPSSSSLLTSTYFGQLPTRRAFRPNLVATLLARPQRLSRSVCAETERPLSSLARINFTAVAWICGYFLALSALQAHNLSLRKWRSCGLNQYLLC